MQPQNLREQRYARAVDREIAPVWHDRFASLLWRHLPAVPPALTLDVHCGPGRTTAELLDRLDPTSRVVGLEPSAAMRSLAKSRIEPEWKDRVYLKAGEMADVSDMEDDTYDLVTANLVLAEALDMVEALRGLIRVTKPGGTILATVPMHGTWAEPEDLFREVLRDSGLEASVQRLRRLANLRLTGHEVARVAADAGIASHHLIIEQERYQLLFRSGREFLFSPLVEFGPLKMWKAIVTGSGNPQELFWRLKEAIDTYFAGQAFTVTVNAGLLRIEVPLDTSSGAHPATPVVEYWRTFPELDALFTAREGRTLTVGGEELDIDIDVDESETSGRATIRVTAISQRVDALLGMLGQSRPSEDSDSELDALLDQVLEFAGPKEQVEEIEDDELEEVDGEGNKAAGETLKRIKALLPPPPNTPPKLPPPPPTKSSKRS